MWLSTKCSSVEMEGHWVKVNVLLSWIAKIAHRSREKEMVQHIQDNIWLYWLNVMMYSKQIGKATIENSGLPTKTTKGRKHQRCKRGWFHTSNTVSIFVFLLKFMFPEQKSYLSLTIARCVGMKHPNIKRCTLSSTTKASGMDISALASSLRWTDAGTKASNF